MVERDYQSAMHKFIDDHLPSGDIVVSSHAEKLIALLDEQDPELLYGWLMQCAPALLAEFIRTQFQRARTTERRNSYGKALREGDTAKLRNGLFTRERFVIDENGHYRRLGDMTGKDHAYVAKGYDADSKTAGLRAAFHKAVAQQVGDRRTEEVLSPEAYLGLWRQIVGS